MNQEVALKIVLAVVGVIFLALAYPMLIFARQDPARSMLFSLYVALGVFLLLAIRDPSANRSLIALTAWSSFAHAIVMFQGQTNQQSKIVSARCGRCSWQRGSN